MGKKLYAYIVLARYIIRIRVDVSSSNGEFEIVADFLKEDLPVCMSAFCLNSKLYVAGGEKYRKDCKMDLLCRYKYDFDKSGRDNGFNPEVYVLGDDEKFYRDPRIPQMKAAKVQPKVANIDGKLYMLSTSAYFDRTCEVPCPKFECLDYANGSCVWEPLPDPPHYQDNDDRSFTIAQCITNFLAMEDKIYVRNAFGVSYYSTGDRQWRSLACDFIEKSVPCPFMTRSIAHGEDGVLVALTDDSMFVAYKYDDEHKLICHQVLEDLTYDVPFPHSHIEFIRHMRNNKFCFVISENNCLRDSVCPFFISTFEVTLNTSLDNGNVFLNAKIISFQVCCMHPKIPARDDRTIRDVFIM